MLGGIPLSQYKPETMSMPVVLSGEYEAMRQAVSGFAQQLLGVEKLISGCTTDAERFQKTKPIYEAATGAGLIRGQISKPLGGDATSNFSAAIVVEEFYAVDRTASLTIFGTGLGLTPLMMAGSGDQHKKYLAPFLETKGAPLASLVYTEPTGTANYRDVDGPGIQTTARLEGDEWVLNGEKVGSSVGLVIDNSPLTVTPRRCGPPTVPAGTSRVLSCSASSARMCLSARATTLPCCFSSAGQTSTPTSPVPLW